VTVYLTELEANLLEHLVTSYRDASDEASDSPGDFDRINRLVEKLRKAQEPRIKNWWRQPWKP